DHPVDARRRVVAVPAAEPSDRPFTPRQGQAEQEQRDEVGNHERPALILCRQAGKSQKITQPHRAARDRQDDAQTRRPSLFRLIVQHEPHALPSLRLKATPYRIAPTLANREMPYHSSLSERMFMDPSKEQVTPTNWP